MITIKSKDNCCGCSACTQICPTKCISIKYDDEGFPYPSTNNPKCINCNLCNSVCPIIHHSFENEALKSYAAFAINDKIRFNSSSGGVFSLVAESVLNNGGIVFGAAFSDDYLAVNHIEINSISGLQKLRGSKYLQSNTLDTFKKVKEYLPLQKLVLYSGVACQIAGLKNFLQKNYSNLITIDILCHGVPSPKIWKKYIMEKEQEFKQKIIKVEFRNKEKGWKSYSLKFTFENMSTWSEVFRMNNYSKIFLQNVGLRPSCYNCKFKDMERPSDITLGDFWGIENYLPELDDDGGISIVLLHSKVGIAYFDEVQDKLRYKSVDPDKALPVTVDSRHSVEIPRQRASFFEDLDIKSTVSLMKLLRDPLYKRVLRKGKRILQKIVADREK